MQTKSNNSPTPSHGAPHPRYSASCNDKRLAILCPFVVLAISIAVSYFDLECVAPWSMSVWRNMDMHGACYSVLVRIVSMVLLVHIPVHIPALRIDTLEEMGIAHLDLRHVVEESNCLPARYPRFCTASHRTRVHQ
ncbi:hypothetical protein IW261DRAFT_1513063, partial [Armillaria novae-zelandiae]